jgi:hypothetical protein
MLAVNMADMMAGKVCVLTIIYRVLKKEGACGGAVVEALRYKPEGRGIDSRWCYWNFSLT